MFSGKVIFLVSMVFLIFNFRYFFSITDSVRTFIGIYDFTSNLFYTSNVTKSLMGTCLNNECTMTNYINHPQWAVEFYKSYLKETNQLTIRNILLLVHIFSNSVSLCIMMLQPYFIANNFKKFHKWLGYSVILLLFSGLSSSCFLASYHKHISVYGGIYSSFGYYNMALTCILPACIGLFYILNKNVNEHKKWMVRSLGAMWGSFFIFRLVEFVIFPVSILINSEYFKNPGLINIWASAITGLLLADWYFSDKESIEKKKK